MSEDKKKDQLERLVKGYETMLDRASAAIETTQKRTLPMLQEMFESLQDKAVELGELTREEAEKVSRYLERDLHDAADFIVDTGQEFRDWLSFDWQLMNERLLDAFASMADQTTSALQEIAERAQNEPVYRAGEVAGPGTLVCSACGETFPSTTTRLLEPCPICGGTEFGRPRPGEDQPEPEVDQGDVDGD